MWIADQADHSLVEIDPRTGSILYTITLDLAPTGLAAARGQIWAAGYAAGAVDQIDLASHQVVARPPVGQGPSAIVAGGGSIWVANRLDGTLTRIDAATGQVLSQAPVGSGPAALAVTGNSVWVANEYSGQVVQVDARTGVMRSVVHSGGRPTTLTADGKRVWVGGGPATSLHRGGTLTLSGTTPPNSLDPAFELSGSWEPTQLTRLVHDTLVTFANAPGTTGLRLVPDLAVALPQPTDRGRTYVFHIRPGIRYSTGRVVRASDFRRAFERLFRAASPGTGFYTSIVGAGACHAGRAPCDLSKGVVADDADRTVTFHLTAAGSGLPVQAHGIRLRRSGTAGRPRRATWATQACRAPGRTESSPPGRTASGSTATRTSASGRHAAQPDGNPDTIVWTFPVSHDAEIGAIEQGRADWTLDFIPVDQLDRIRTAHPGQLHVNPAFIVEFIPLNPNLPPFDSIKVRQALNLAIDRREIARLYGGSIVGTPLCQPLPPGMPGYVRYCPYTRAPERRGTYDGPDLRARATARSSLRSRGVTASSFEASPTPRRSLRASRPTSHACLRASVSR